MIQDLEEIVTSPKRMARVVVCFTTDQNPSKEMIQDLPTVGAPFESNIELETEEDPETRNHFLIFEADQNHKVSQAALGEAVKVAKKLSVEMLKEQQDSDAETGKISLKAKDDAMIKAAETWSGVVFIYGAGFIKKLKAGFPLKSLWSKMSIKLNANTKITQVVVVDSQNAEEIEKEVEHNDRKDPFAFSFPYYVKNTWGANKINLFEETGKN